MEIDSVGSAAAHAVIQAKTGDAVALTVFKKAMDLQRQNAMQLIEAAKVTPAVQGSLGSRIDIKV